MEIRPLELYRLRHSKDSHLDLELIRLQLELYIFELEWLEQVAVVVDIIPQVELQEVAELPVEIQLLELLF
jgi:hypothetical protein